MAILAMMAMAAAALAAVTESAQLTPMVTVTVTRARTTGTAEPALGMMSSVTTDLSSLWVDSGEVRAELEGMEAEAPGWTAEEVQKILALFEQLIGAMRELVSSSWIATVAVTFMWSMVTMFSLFWFLNGPTRDDVWRALCTGFTWALQAAMAALGKLWLAIKDVLRWQPRDPVA